MVFQLIASSFILNSTTRTNEYPIYPYLHSFSNIRNKEDLLTPSWIPDVSPNEIVESVDGKGGETKGDFSFAAGDFLELYGGDAAGTSSQTPGSTEFRECFAHLRGSHGFLAADWDACVTCFFIDTARSVPHYLETIYGLLKPGGTWINCG